MSLNLLSEKDLQSIFLERIVPAFAGKIKQQEHPAAIIFGGQPGSGKSALISEIVKQNHEYCVINGDDLRGFHPQMYDLLKTDEENASDLVQPDCNFWIENLISYISERGGNMIIEGTMRRSEVPLNTARLLKDKGYSVEANIIACHPFVSFASIYYRYEAQKKILLNARFTRAQSHDISFLNIPKTLSDIYLSKEIPSLKIFSRKNSDFNLSYENKLVNGKWAENKNPAESFNELTIRSLSSDEDKYLLEIWNKTIKLVTERKAENSYLKFLKDNLEMIKTNGKEFEEMSTKYHIPK